MEITTIEATRTIYKFTEAALVLALVAALELEIGEKFDPDDIVFLDNNYIDSSDKESLIAVCVECIEKDN